MQPRISVNSSLTHQGNQQCDPTSLALMFSRFLDVETPPVIRRFRTSPEWLDLQLEANCLLLAIRNDEGTPLVCQPSETRNKEQPLPIEIRFSEGGPAQLTILPQEHVLLTRPTHIELRGWNTLVSVFKVMS